MKTPLKLTIQFLKYISKILIVKNSSLNLIMSIVLDYCKFYQLAYENVFK